MWLHYCRTTEAWGTLGAASLFHSSISLFLSMLRRYPWSPFSFLFCLFRSSWNGLPVSPVL
jgi:hypothetical protein